MRIRTRLGVLPIALTMTVLIASLIITLQIAGSIMRNEIGNHLLTSVQFRTQTIETFLKAHKDTVEILAVGIPFTNVLDPQIEYTRRMAESSQRIARTIATCPGITRIRIVNADGIVVSSSNQDIGLDESARAAFTNGQERVFVGELHKSIHTGTLVLSISAPIAVRGVFAGVLIINFEVQGTLFDVLANVEGLGETGETYLVDGNGRMMTPSRFADDSVSNVELSSEQVKLFVSEHIDGSQPPEMEEMPTVYVNYRGREVLGTHRFIPGMPWRLIGEIETGEAFAPIYRQTTALVVVFCGLLIVLVILAIINSRAIILPLARLREGTEEIIKSNLDYKVGIATDDEIGWLSQSFDIMSDRLRRAQKEINDHTEELESRVEERTADLERQYEKSEKQRIANLVVLDDLSAATTGLKAEIAERKQAQMEREKLQVQLNQAQKMESVGRLAGGVAHDFNNMLGVILGHTELALEQMDPTQPFYAGLQEIHEAAGRSADLTRQLLAFARKQTIAPKVLNLNETIEGMLKMLRRLIGEDIDLAWVPGSEVWPVKVDPSQIDQILANLCVNARAAITDVGKVAIETGNVIFDAAYCEDRPGLVPGEYVLLAVSDNGCGMDKETLGKLFEPFFTTKKEGSGLGLATVYGIVKQNDGFINVYSEPGDGTTFRLYLRRHAGKAAQMQEEIPAEPVARGNETILLAEDESAILKLATTMLEHQGYTVLAASTPDEAIRLAEEHTGEIQLLMTDVVMPEMNGRELAKYLLSLYPDVKRLFMSGYTANVIAHRGVIDEGVNFIQKPFTMQDLAAKVREALDGD